MGKCKGTVVLVYAIVLGPLAAMRNPFCRQRMKSFIFQNKPRFGYSEELATNNGQFRTCAVNFALPLNAALKSVITNFRDEKMSNS